MWTKLSGKKPPEGNCSENLLLLWIKCPDEVKYPECWMGYEMGFFDGTIFLDNNYRYRIDHVEYWSLLHERPTAENVEDANLQPTTAAACNAANIDC